MVINVQFKDGEQIYEASEWNVYPDDRHIVDLIITLKINMITGLVLISIINIIWPIRIRAY